jgi:hypothetical protein
VKRLILICATLPLLAGPVLMPAAAFAAKPSKTVHKMAPKSTDPGDAEVEKLNQQQLDKNK